MEKKSLVSNGNKIILNLLQVNDSSFVYFDKKVDNSLFIKKDNLNNFLNDFKQLLDKYTQTTLNDSEE